MNESGRHSARLVAGVLFVLAFSIFAGSAHASALYAQYTNTVTSSDANLLEMCLGTGITGAFPTSITASVTDTGSSGGDTVWYRILDVGTTPCGGTAFSSNWNANDQYTLGNTSVPSGTNLITASSVVVSNIGSNFDPTHYYVLRLQNPASHTQHYGGSSVQVCGLDQAGAGGAYDANVYNSMFEFDSSSSYTAGSGCVGFTPPPPPNTNTRIDSLSPADASTTASTVVPITVGYYLNSSANPAGYDTVGFTVYDIDRTFSIVAYATTTATTSSLSTFTKTLTLRSGGAYQLQAFLLNSSNGNELFSGSDATGANNLGNADFAVVSNPLPGIIGTSTYSGLYSLATSTCAVTNITGCFQNAIAWAFYPSAAMLQYVGNAGDGVKSKPPFGYIIVYITALQSLNASGTPPVSLATDAPITTYIFHPFDVGIGVLFFFFFGVWFVLRLRKIEL